MRPLYRHFEEINHLLRLALPVLSANIFSALMELCDTFMASKTEVKIDLLVFSKISALWFPILFLLQNILLNNLPLIVRFRAAAEHERIRETFWNGIWLATGISLLGFFILSFAPYLFSTILAGNEVGSVEIQRLMFQYCHILRWGCPAFFFYSIFKSLADGACKTIIGTNIGLAGLCCSLLLNWLFIYGHCGAPELGVLGCAISTVLSYWIMSSLFCLTFFMNLGQYQAILGAQLFKFQWPKAYRLSKQFFQGAINGLVHFIESLAFNAAIFFLDGQKSSSSKIEVASIRLTGSITDFLYLLPLSISIAATIRIGGLLGQGAPLKALRRTKNVSLFLGCSIATINCLALFLFRTKISNFSNDAPEIQQLTRQLLTYAALYQLPEAIQVVCFGILRAHQKLLTLLSLNFFAFWIVAVPVGAMLALTSWMTPKPLGAVGFWMALVLGLSCAALLSFLKVSNLLNEVTSSPISEKAQEPNLEAF